MSDDESDFTEDQLLAAIQVFERLVADATDTLNALHSAGFSEDEVPAETA
jgi:hypothetical protein